MAIFNYMIWQGGPDIFSIGALTIRWYGLLFALGFIISQQILYYFHRKEGKPEKDVDTLTIYMVVATIIGARLGHIIFYQPEIFLEDPLSVFLPFSFQPTFHFTGFLGLASHGGAIGILIALWFYSNCAISFTKTNSKGKKSKGLFFIKRVRPNQSYLQVLDRIVILVAITGACIRMGNFFNSEILGKPTDLPTGIVFAHSVIEELKGNSEFSNNIVEKVEIKKIDSAKVSATGKVPIEIFLSFKSGVSLSDAQFYVQNNVKNILTYRSENIEELPNSEINFKSSINEKTNQAVVQVITTGIIRHPAQLYESASCALLFIFLFSIWNRYKINLPAGRVFGYFMIILWSLRFSYEFLKENQVPFEDNLPLNMGQILSIPLIVVGIIILIRSYKKKSIQKV